MSEAEQSIWLPCANCNNKYRNHRVLCEKTVERTDEPGGPTLSTEYHRFVQCMGCNSFKYASSIINNERYGFEYGLDEEMDWKVFPDAPSENETKRLPKITTDEAVDEGGTQLIPELVWKMYKETINAFNAGVFTLCGGGLRATVEAICLNEKISAPNLQEKINELAQKNLLTKNQADLLHEERYLGNAALHELETPSSDEIEDGLTIVEGLMSTIYILPSKMKRLRKGRALKAAKKKGKK
jgi:hypothetical protein